MNGLLNSLYPGDGLTLLAFNALLQITAVILLTMLVARTFLRRAAAARHAAWAACLAFVAVCPLLTCVASRAGVSIVSLPLAAEETASAPSPVAMAHRVERQPGPPTVQEPIWPMAEEVRRETTAPVMPPRTEHRRDERPSATVAASATSVAPAPVATSRWSLRSTVSLAVAIWAAGAALFTIRLLHGALALRKLGRTTVRLDESGLVDVLARVRRSLGVAKLPPILLSDQITTPIVAALPRPSILLPASLPESITRDSLHEVLVHECAHILRRDHWVGVLQRLVETVYWFHPLVRHMNGRLAFCREEVCDNHVLSAVAPADYADTLLGLTGRWGSRPGALGSIGMFGLRWRLEDRVRDLLDGRRDPSVRLPNRWRVTVAAATCIVFTAAAMLQIDTVARVVADESKQASDTPEAESAAATENSVNISSFGNVVDAQGNPVASATVYLREAASYRTVTDLYAPSFQDVLGSTQTNAQGAFRLEGVTPPLAPNQNGGKWDVVVVAEGYGMAWRHLRNAEDETPITLTLQGETAITGRLVGQDGQPVAGVQVNVIGFAGLGSPVRESGDPLSRMNLWRSQLAMTVQTDVDGRFSFEGLPPQRRVFLIGTHDRHARKIFYAATTDRPQPDLPDVGYYDGERRETAHKVHTGDFTVTLEPGYQIHGQVTFADTKQPCPKAKVSISWKSRANYTTADAEGRFVFSGLSLSPSQWYVYVSTAEPGDYLRRRIHVPLHEDQPEVDASIELPRGELVTGLVVGETGEPIPGVKVGFRTDLPTDAPDRLGAMIQTTDEDGAFRMMAPVGKGRLDISGAVNGYDLSSSSGVSEEEPRFVYSIEVKRGEPTPDIRFTVGRGLVINGRVVDPQGKPVADAEIKRVRSHYRDGHFKDAAATSDADGRFTLNGLSASDAVSLEVRHRQRRLYGVANVEAKEDAGMGRRASVDVQLQAAARVKGRVLIDGRPTAGVRIDLYQYRTYDGEQVGVGVDHTETDDSGRFVFDVAAPGEEFFLSHYSDEFTQPNGHRFDLEPEQTHEPPTFELQSRNMSVAGIVVDPGDNPVEGISVSVSKRTGEPIAGAFTRQPTSTDGRFVIPGVPNVPLRIMAYIGPPNDAADRRIFFSTTVDAQPGELDVRIIFDPKLERVEQ